jgi:hypothetical protein
MAKGSRSMLGVVAEDAVAQLIKSPLWSSLTAAHDPSSAIIGHDPQHPTPAATSTGAVSRR